MAAAAYELVTLVSRLILPRLILTYFGSAYNGITQSATQFLNLISILNLGITASARVALYASVAKGDMERTSAILKATEKHMRKVGTILLLYLMLLTFLYPLVIDTGFPYWDVALLIFASGIGTFAELFFGVTYRTYLDVRQSGYISQIYGIAAILISLVVSVTMIKAGFSIQAVKLASASVYFIKQIIFNWRIPRKYRIDRHAEPHPEALSKRRDATAHSIANIVHDKTDIVLLTLFCNVKIVSVYTVYHMIMSMVGRTRSILTSGIEPVFGDMWARGEKEKIKRSLETFEFVMGAFISVMISSTFVLILPFVALYTKGVHDVEYILPAYAFIATAASSFQALRAPYLSLTQGAGFYKETKKGAYMEAALNIVLSIILVFPLGIVGVAIGTLAANCFRTFQYMFFVEKNIVTRGIRVPILKVLWAGATTAASTLLLYNKAGQLAASSWRAWILTAVCVVLINGAITLVSSLIFYRGDLKEAFALLKNMLRRK